MGKLYDKGKKIGFYCLVILLLSSCASILNGKKTVINLSAEEKSSIIFKKDTFQIHKHKTAIYPERSRKTIKLTVLKDSLKQDFYLRKRISKLFFMNVFNINPYTIGAGFLIDFTNPKRFTYKRNLHFETDRINNQIILSRKKVNSIKKKQFFIYTTPLKSIDFLSFPKITLGGEYFIKENVSISYEYGYGVNLKSRKYFTKEENLLVNESGNMYRFENKWYNIINYTKNAHLNEYISLEFKQTNRQFNDILEYFNKEDINQIDLDIYELDEIRDVFFTKKRVSVINLKYGVLVPIANKFYFDFYSGFGIRIKQVNDFEKDFNSEIHEFYDIDDFPDFDFFSFFDENGTHLNFSLGFKFGYKF